MKIQGCLQFSLHGEKHTFRTLEPHDVNMAYVLGLRKERLFIENRFDDMTMEYQQKYVNDVLTSEIDTICGLFVGSKLIGTSGIQNLSVDKSKNRMIEMSVGSTSNCTLGMYLFDASMRGKGYGKILMWSSCYLCCHQLGITFMEVSVLKQNIASLKACIACGFKISVENDVGVNMELQVNTELVKPEDVMRPVIQ